MELKGKRKFVVFLISIGIFLGIMIFVVSKMAVFDNSTLTGLGIFAGALGGAIMMIAGFFYAGNVLEHKIKPNA